MLVFRPEERTVKILIVTKQQFLKLLQKILSISFLLLKEKNFKISFHVGTLSKNSPLNLLHGRGSEFQEKH